MQVLYRCLLAIVFVHLPPRTLAAWTGNPQSLEAMLELYDGSAATLLSDESSLAP